MMMMMIIIIITKHDYHLSQFTGVSLHFPTEIDLATSSGVQYGHTGEHDHRQHVYDVVTFILGKVPTLAELTWTQDRTTKLTQIYHLYRTNVSIIQLLYNR